MNHGLFYLAFEFFLKFTSTFKMQISTPGTCHKEKMIDVTVMADLVSQIKESVFKINLVLVLCFINKT